MSQKKQDITFTVETVRRSQKPYGDTFTDFIVESTQCVDSIKKFCTKVLKPAISREEFKALPTDGDNFGNHFAPYYTELEVLVNAEFPSEGKSKVSYKHVSPSTS